MPTTTAHPNEAIELRNSVRPGTAAEPFTPQRESWPLRLKLLLTVIIALTPVAIVSVIQGLDRIRRGIETVDRVPTDLLLPIFMLGLASLAIWIATDRQVTRWIVYLRRIAAAYGRGHYAVRPNVMRDAPQEFRDLADTFSVMADAVQDRDKKLRDAVLQKSMLIKEIHHRVKNNLQIVMSLLSLQAGQLRDPAAKAALQQAQARVNALALVHRILHEIEEQKTIALKDLIRDLAAQIAEGFGSERRNVRIAFDLVERQVSGDEAVPLALFVVEALTNVFKHAYPNAGGGRVRLSLHAEQQGKMLLSIEDDGVGLAEGLPRNEGRGSGTRLVQAFAQQIGGETAMTARPGGGTAVTLLFNDPEAPAPANDRGADSAATRSS
jgi:two-component sensor histidine kinase